MLYHMIWKDFRRDFKNYVPLFLSIVLSTVFLNIIIYANASGVQMALEGYLDFGTVKGFALSVPVCIVLSVFMMSYTMNHYIRSRGRSYQMFQILGIESKVFKKILFFEYCCGGIMAVGLGMLCGFVLTAALNHFIQHYFAVEVLLVSWGKIFVISSAVSFILCVLLLVWNYMLLSRKELSELGRPDLLAGQPKAGKTDRVYMYLGILMAAAGVYLLSPEFLGVNFMRIVGTVLYIIGWIFFLLFGMKCYLQYFKRRSRFYHRHLLSISNFFSQFHNSRKLLTGAFLVYFLLFALLFRYIFMIFPGFDSGEMEDSAAFDVVWINGEKDREKINEIDKKYSAETEDISYLPVRVLEMDNGYSIGISEKQYIDLGGKPLSLATSEVFSVTQGGKRSIYVEEPQLSFQDKFEFGETETEYEQYQLTGWKDEVLVVRLFEIIVFSDSIFEEKSLVVGGPRTMTVQNFPEHVKTEAQGEIFEQQGRWDLASDQGVYCRKHEGQISLMENIITEILMTVFVTCLMLYSTYFLGIHVWSRIPQWQRQNEFLRCLGMRRKARKKLILGEMKQMMFLPVAGALVCWFLYVVVDCFYFGAMTGNMKKILIEWAIEGLMVLIFLLFQILYYMYMRTHVLNRTCR